MAGAAVFALLAAGAGTAAARTATPGDGGAAGGNVAQAQLVADSSRSTVDRESKRPGKPPRPTPSPTSSPTAGPTPTPTTTTSPPSTDVNVQIPIPGYTTGFRFGDILVDEAHGRIYITGGKGTDDLSSPTWTAASCAPFRASPAPPG